MTDNTTSSPIAEELREIARDLDRLAAIDPAEAARHLNQIHATHDHAIETLKWHEFQQMERERKARRRVASVSPTKTLG